MDYRQIITIEPGKRGGRPRVRGRRITVRDVLGYLASGMSEDEIREDFPYLTRDDIRACLAYAAEREQAKLPAASKLLFDENLSPRLVAAQAMEFPGSRHVHDVGLGRAQKRP